MAQAREVAQVWLVSATAIVLSYAAHSPSVVLTAFNAGATLACLALTLAHHFTRLSDRAAVYACAALLAVDIVLSAVRADGFAGMNLVWPMAVAFPTLAVFGWRRFYVFAGLTTAAAMGLMAAQYAGAFELELDVATEPTWWWQTLFWILLLLVVLPMFMHQWQQRYLEQVHHKSLVLEQMDVELTRQTWRQHRFLARVARFLRSPLHDVWLQYPEQDAPKRSSALMAAAHDLYVTLSNLQDSGALDEAQWTQFHPSPLRLPEFIRAFQDFPPHPERALTVQVEAGLTEWVECDGKRLGQLLTNVLAVARSVSTAQITLRVQHQDEYLMIHVDLPEEAQTIAQWVEVLRGERALSDAHEGACLRLLIVQRWAETLGGSLMLLTEGREHPQLQLRLRAPRMSAADIDGQDSTPMQLALVLARGAVVRPVSGYLRTSLLGDHTWRVLEGPKLPEVRFDVVVVMLDDWLISDQDTQRFFAALRANHQCIWGITDGLSMEENAEWRGLGLSRIWLRPIDDTAWHHQLRMSLTRSGAEPQS